MQAILPVSACDINESVRGTSNPFPALRMTSDARTTMAPPFNSSAFPRDGNGANNCSSRLYEPA